MPQPTTKKTSIHHALFAIFFFILTTFIFNWFLIPEVLNSNPYRTRGEDTIPLQYFAEAFKTRIQQGENPLSPTLSLLHPLGGVIATGEVGSLHTLYFIFLRPLFTPHGSFQAMVLINFFLAQLFMYLLLRFLKINRSISLLIALAYASAPPISFPRLTQHYTYLHYYFFPLISLLLLKSYHALTHKSKYLYATASGVSFGLLAYATYYYLVMYTIFLFAFIVSYLVLTKNLKLIIKNYLPVTGCLLLVTLITLVPLLTQFLPIITHHMLPTTGLTTGYLDFSANLFSLFIPSPANPVYGHFLNQFVWPFQPTESVIYPGLISFLGLTIFIKKIIKKDSSLNPISYLLFLISCFMLLLCLGPFFQVIVPWKNALKKTALPIPLPYQILTYIPVAKLLRAPARFGILLNFSLLILAAYMLNSLKTKNKKDYSLFLIPLFLIVFLDQSYYPIHPSKDIKLPQKSYEYIKADKSNVSVMELPFNIRDGVRVFGSFNALNNFLGQSIHQKPVIGGYLARLDDAEFDYYTRCPVLHNGIYVSEQHQDKPEGDLPTYALNSIKTGVNFLNIKYLLIKKDLFEYESFIKNYSQMGFTTIYENDQDYTLLSRTPEATYSASLNLETTPVECILFGGWSNPVPGGRWLTIKIPKSGVILKLPPENKFTKLEITGFAIDQPRRLFVTLNHQFIGTITLTTKVATHTLETSLLKSELNRLDFRVADTQKPLEQDSRTSELLVGISTVQAK